MFDTQTIQPNVLVIDVETRQVAVTSILLDASGTVVGCTPPAMYDGPVLWRDPK